MLGVITAWGGRLRGNAARRVVARGAGSREVGQVTDSFLPMLTPEGARHPVFANIAHFFPTQAGRRNAAAAAGRLHACGIARPGATVLAFCPMDVNKMPVLATQPVGKGCR